MEIALKVNKSISSRIWKLTRLSVMQKHTEHLASSVFIKPLNSKPHRYNNFSFTEPMLPNCDVCQEFLRQYLEESQRQFVRKKFFFSWNCPLQFYPSYNCLTMYSKIMLYLIPFVIFPLESLTLFIPSVSSMGFFCFKESVLSVVSPKIRQEAVNAQVKKIPWK